jgi:hypothetical protein
MARTVGRLRAVTYACGEVSMGSIPVGGGLMSGMVLCPPVVSNAHPSPCCWVRPPWLC